MGARIFLRPKDSTDELGLVEDKDLLGLTTVIHKNSHDFLQ
jgi:hypothetical protein